MRIYALSALALMASVVPVSAPAVTEVAGRTVNYSEIDLDAMTVSIDSGGPGTEFGLLLADWSGSAVPGFYSKGRPVYRYTSSPFSVACAEQYYQMTGGAFDRVDIDLSSTTGNWCLPALHFEQSDPGGLQPGRGWQGHDPGLERRSAAEPTLHRVAGHDRRRRRERQRLHPGCRRHYRRCGLLHAMDVGSLTLSNGWPPPRLLRPGMRYSGKACPEM